MRPLIRIYSNKKIIFSAIYNKMENEYQFQIPFISINCDELGLWILRFSLWWETVKHSFKYYYPRIFGYYWKPVFRYRFKTIYSKATGRRLGVLRDIVQTSEGIKYVYRSKYGFVGINATDVYTCNLFKL